jgi:hypothetical protein
MFYVFHLWHFTYSQLLKLLEFGFAHYFFWGLVCLPAQAPSSGKNFLCAHTKRTPRHIYIYIYICVLEACYIYIYIYIIYLCVQSLPPSLRCVERSAAQMGRVWTSWDAWETFLLEMEKPEANGAAGPPPVKHRHHPLSASSGN